MTAFRREVQSLSVMVAQAEAEIADLRDRLRRHGCSDTQIRGIIDADIAPVRNLARLLGPLPPSAVHDPADPTSLFVLCLRAANAAIDACVRRRRCDGEHGVAALMTVVLASLVYDLGRLWYVQAAPADDDQARPWKCVDGYLVDDAVQGVPGCFTPGTQLIIRWRQGCTRGGFTGSEPLAVWFLSQVVPQRMLAWIGLQQANNLPAMLCHSLQGGVLGHAHTYVQAGYRLAQEQLHQVDRQPQAKVAFADGSIADDVVALFQRCVTAGQLIVNVAQGNVFTSATHTVLPVTASGSVPSIFTTLHGLARQQIQAEGCPLDRRRWYATHGPGDMIDALGAATIDEHDQPRCCTGSDGQARHVWRMVSADTGTIVDRHGLAVVIPHAALWGVNDPVTMFGISTVPMGFWDYHHQGPSLVAEDLGFVGIDPLATSPTEDAVGTTQDLSTAVTELWRTIDILWPISTAADQPHAPLQQIAQHIANQQAIPPALALDMIGRCVDRLRDFQAQQQGAAAHSLGR